MDQVDDILNRINVLSSTEKSRLLRKLVKRTGRNSTEMNFLRSLVQAVPLGSNLERLPEEVFSKVIGNLDSRTLGRLAGTCRRLSVAILNDFRPWKLIFDQENSSGKISEVTRAFQAQITESVRNASKVGSQSAYTGNSTLPYTSAFFYEARLQSNWSRVTPGERPVGFDCHGGHVVTCMEIDPKGRYILTGSDDGTVRLWNVQDEPRELVVFSGHLGGVWALKVDWDREILVTGSTDRTLIVWDLHSGERLRHLLGHTSTVRCVELVNESDLIVSGSRDGTLRVWSLESGECLHILQGHLASVRCLCICSSASTSTSERDISTNNTSTKDMIVSGSYDNTCKLWDLQTGQCLRTFTGHTNKVYAVSSTPEHIYSGSLDGSVRVWEAASGVCVKVFEGHRSLVGLVQCKAPDTTLTGSTDGSLQLIKHNATDDSFDSILLPTAHPTSITSLDFNRNFLVTGSEGVVRLWSIQEPSSPRLLANLIESVDMVWRVNVTDHLACVAYQYHGQTRLAIFNFAPQPQQVLIEMKAFKVTNTNYNPHFNPQSNKTSKPQNSHNNQQTYSNYAYIQQHNYHETIDDSTRMNSNSHLPVAYTNENNCPNSASISTSSNTHNTTSHHPELLVLGMASQSLVEHVDDLMYIDD
jgi:WD40 repeat protein